METVQVRVSNLTSAALDWAVAKCEGYTPTIRLDNGYGIAVMVANFPGDYSTDWAYGGPIIEREGISMACRPRDARGLWCAVLGPHRFLCPDYEGYAPTPLMAAMRCYVASKLGDVVDIPEKLL